MAAVTEHQEIPAPLLTGLPSLGLDARSIAADFRRHFNHTLGCDIHSKYAFHLYEALAMSLRDRLMVMWKNTHYSYREHDCRRAYYLSLEFLMGRTLGNALLNLGIQQVVREALQELGLRLEDMVDHRAGRGPRQRRPRASRRLLSRQLRHAATAGHGLRHPLRVRHVPPDASRTATRSRNPITGCATATRGSSSGPEFTQRIQFGGRTELLTDEHGKTRAAGWTPTTCWRSPTTPPSPATATTPSTPCACGRRRRPTSSIWGVQRRHYPESVAEKNAAENITHGALPERRDRDAARSCACASSISWSPPRCRT